jgi:hypothetical protein
MSQAAERSAGDEGEETTGQFPIGEHSRSSTVLPPAGEQAELVSLEDLGAVLEPDAEAVDARTAPGVRGSVSGVFTGRPQPSSPPPVPPAAEDAALTALADSLQPYYREHERRQGERAQLEVMDLSLQPGNPYSSSSLVPPPSKPFPWAKSAAVLGGVAVALAGGLVLRAALTAPGASVEQEIRAPIAAPASAAVAVEHVAPRTEEPAAELTEARAAVAEPERQDAFAAESVRKEPVAVRVEQKVASARARALDTESRATNPASGTEHDADQATAPKAAEPVRAAPPAEAEVAAAASPADLVSAEPVTALPDLPSREDVAAGFQTVHEQLVRCAAGKHGIAKLDVTIAGTGRISHAVVDGAFAGTPEGSCMARAVRAARFPQFGQRHIKVSYPISF